MNVIKRYIASLDWNDLIFTCFCPEYVITDFFRNFLSLRCHEIFKDRVHSMNLPPLTITAVKTHFQHLAISAIWYGLLLQTRWQQVNPLWFCKLPAGSPRADQLSQQTHHLLPTKNRLEKHHLVGRLAKMFWCQPGCACCAGTRPLLLFSKGALAHGAVLCRVTAQGSLWLGHLHACFCPFWCSLIQQHLWLSSCHLATSRSSPLHLPWGNVVPSIPFLHLAQSYPLPSLLENQVRIETMLGGKTRLQSIVLCL